MFSEQDIQLVLQDFPKFELCYEIITHKKVLGSNVILAIPHGKKAFAWFTSYKNDNVCFILEIGENKHIIDIQIVTTSFIGTAKINGNTYTSISNSRDYLVLSYNNFGTIQWVNQFGGVNYDYPQDIAANNNNIYLADFVKITS